ncbi:hypothetical protein BSL78_13902 [Apostichopus japonicus]|uniref:Mediator of RNA polymerase II transcription subunit 23 n=1 Tax=Stichopus japonicus TaxID=307972 RepID=A0A2G8KMN0_STIJA|nr:hypothetical protein BSL78_13902 [Apostichopus japonicus]
MVNIQAILFCSPAGPTEPLSMTMLDSLSTHTKLSFIHHIATNKIGQVANRNTTLALSPAMMETYSRLLVYVELESLGIKTLISSETLSWTWCRGILEKLQTNTPHNWATHTLRCFPSSLQQFFEQNATQMENRTGLKELVDESYRSWSGLTTDQDKVAYFTGKGVSPHFLW